MKESEQRRIFGGIGQSAIERVRTNSAMNPLLWLNGCSLPFTIPGAIWGPHPLNMVMMTIAGTTILSAVAAYFIWMFRDPNRLQSEDYQLEHQRMLLLGDERAPGVVIDATAATVPNNPTARLESAK